MNSEYLHSQALGENRASLKRGMLVMDEELVEGDKLGRGVTMSWFLVRLRAEVEEGGRMLVGHERRDTSWKTENQMYYKGADRAIHIRMHNECRRF